MNNVFSRVQMLETSDVCNKYSKSVSYETLVGGTTTTGREYKQIRRLSKGSAIKPLTAVGTLTSLLCNSAKVVETWLQISPVLRLVKVLGLVAVLSFTIITESWAETWDCGEIANTVSCSLDENGVFTISGTGKMKDYQRAKINTNTTGWFDNRPWGSIEIANGEFTNIQTAVVGKGVTYIGTNAFEGFSCIKELKGMDDVEEIGGDAFYGADLDNVNMPKVKIVGDHAFLSNKNLKNINMPNVEVFYGHSFTGVPIGSYSGDCLQYKNGNCVRNDKWRCLSGYLLKENICIDSADGCGAGYKDMGGWCNRIQYTPAEAAPLLKDNDNVIVLTFKK